LISSGVKSRRALKMPMARTRSVWRDIFVGWGEVEGGGELWGGVELVHHRQYLYLHKPFIRWSMVAAI
jgi:hypothetical protein